MEQMNICMELYLHVCINHHQDDWVKWVPVAKFAVNNGASEMMKFIHFGTAQGIEPPMTFIYFE